jgi:putative transposase
LDEVFVRIHGTRHCLWRAVDQNRNILDILVQRRRETAAAKQFLRGGSKISRTFHESSSPIS